MNARYQDPVRGQFISEDPILLTPSSGQALNALLEDPQKMNFYSYVEDNPLRYTDPTGRTSSVIQAVQSVLAQFGLSSYLPSFLSNYNVASGGSRAAGPTPPRLFGNPTGSAGTFYYQPPPLQPGTLPYYLSQPLQPFKKALEYSDQLGQQYQGEIKQNNADGKTWIAPMQPRSPGTQRWANLITTVDAAYAGQGLGLGIIGTAGFSAVGGLASHIGDTQPISTQDVGNIGAKAGTSAINRAIEGLADGEALGPYSLLPDVAGDYILEYGAAYSTLQLP
jgi:RHS repeat-associated protein